MKTHRKCPGRGLTNRSGAQQGVVLFMTLIALVAMTLAALALVRSTDTTNMVAGNLAIKQGAIQEADKVMNLAFKCLDRAGSLLSSPLSVDNPGCNYYATFQPDLAKPFSIPDVLESASGGVTNSATGNTTTYVIERMCAAGTVLWDAANCIESPFGRAQNLTDRGEPALTPPQALYRISVKVAGPRNVASYSQMVLNASQ